MSFYRVMVRFETDEVSKSGKPKYINEEYITRAESVEEAQMKTHYYLQGMRSFELYAISKSKAIDFIDIEISKKKDASSESKIETSEDKFADVLGNL